MILARTLNYLYDRLLTRPVSRFVNEVGTLTLDELLETERMETRRSEFRARLFRATMLGMCVVFAVIAVFSTGVLAQACIDLDLCSFSFYWLYLRTLPLVLTFRHLYIILEISKSHDSRVIPSLINGLNSSFGGLPIGIGYDRIVSALISRTSELRNGATVSLETDGIDTVSNIFRRAWFGYGSFPQCLRLVQGLLLLPDLTKYSKIRRLLENLAEEEPRQEWEGELQKMFQFALSGRSAGSDTDPYAAIVTQHLPNGGSAQNIEGKILLILRKMPIPIASLILGPLTIVLAALMFISPIPFRLVLGICLFMTYTSIGLLSAYLYIAGSRTRLQWVLLVTLLVFLFMSIVSGLFPIGAFTTGLPCASYKSIPWHLAIVAASSFIFLLCLRLMSFSWRVHVDGNTSNWKKWRYLAWP